MKTHIACKLLAVALSPLFLAAAVGCNSSDGPAPQLAPAPEAAPAAPAAEPELERSTIASSAPFVLSLVTPDTMPSQGELEITANIDAHHRINAPAAIVVETPPGVTLIGGQAEETMVDLPDGVTTRTFRFSLAHKISENAPIKIRVSVVDPGGAFGAHATREYPKKIKLTEPAEKRVPDPPVTRPGAPDRAR